MEVQPLHAFWKFVPAVSGIAGKVARAVQPYHALVKLMALPVSNPVARKEVREVQPYHAA